MISCQEADVLAAALSVGSLDGVDEPALADHLAGCAACRRVAGEYMEAAARLPLALEPLQPPPDLRSRVMRTVYAEAGERHRSPASGLGPWWTRLWSRVPAGPAFTVAGAGAALAVVAVTSWAVVDRHSGAPAPVAVSVRFMQPASHAQGQLVYERSASQAVLTVSSLPRPALAAGGDGVYEVWLIGRDGHTVPAAFLSQAPDGSWTAALRGDMSAYATVAATAEPPGGSPGPTGPEVLEATLAGS